jgi:hypothetical protein
MPVVLLFAEERHHGRLLTTVWNNSSTKKGRVEVNERWSRNNYDASWTRKLGHQSTATVMQKLMSQGGGAGPWMTECRNINGSLHPLA